MKNKRHPTALGILSGAVIVSIIIVSLGTAPGCELFMTTDANGERVIDKPKVKAVGDSAAVTAGIAIPQPFGMLVAAAISAVTGSIVGKRRERKRNAKKPPSTISVPQIVKPKT